MLSHPETVQTGLDPMELKAVTPRRRGKPGKRGRPKREPARICPECNREIPAANDSQCASCLRPFHATCLVRVRLRNKHLTYLLCRQCLQTKKADREIV